MMKSSRSLTILRQSCWPYSRPAGIVPTEDSKTGTSATTVILLGVVSPNIDADRFGTRRPFEILVTIPAGCERGKKEYSVKVQKSVVRVWDQNPRPRGNAGRS
jgi:hypothetical protein